MHGWLILDKPEGITSTKAGYIIKRLSNQKKIGHAGTLDPFASGILPLALGEATKTLPYLMNKTKTYEFDLSFGIQTSTDDTEGEIVSSSTSRPLKEDLQNVLEKFTGLIEQKPSVYSAIKIKGKPAYARTRAGEIVDIPTRKIHIHNLTLNNYDGEKASFTVSCGTGTYVRSLGRDLALHLGSVGHLTKLRRIRVGHFDINDAISLEKIQKIGNNSLTCFLLPIGSVLDDIPAVSVSFQEACKVRQGQTIEISKNHYSTVSVWSEKKLVALGQTKNNMFYPNRVFNN